MDSRGLQARVDELMGEFQRLRAGADELQQKIKAVSVTARSDDKYVTVTVNARGELMELELDPRIYRRPDSKALADTITATLRRASAEAADRVAELCKPLLPESEVRAHLNQDIDGMFRRIDSATLPEGGSR